MRTLLFIIGAIALLFTTSALAQSRTIIDLGYGTNACRTWIEYGKRPSSSAGLIFQNWVLGYISAYNNYKSLSGNVTGATPGPTDNEGLFAWIDNYCRGHPLETLSIATEALILELETRQKTK